MLVVVRMAARRRRDPTGEMPWRRMRRRSLRGVETRLPLGFGVRDGLEADEVPLDEFVDGLLVSFDESTRITLTV